MAKHNVEGVCSYTELPPNAIDKLNSRINNTNARVSQITPYTESKQAYIDDTSVEFVKAKEGIVTCTVIDNDGVQIPCELIITDNVVVNFKPLEKIATVTICIQ